MIAIMEGRPPVFAGSGGKRGGGAGAVWMWLYRAFDPLFEKDRIERKLIKDIRDRIPRSRR